MGIPTPTQYAGNRVTDAWLESRGFSVRSEMPLGYSCDYGGGFILQLIPNAGGWIVELWNGMDDGYCRASFPRQLVYQEELLPILHMMDFVPF
jgi:hypothetical protein